MTSRVQEALIAIDGTLCRPLLRVVRIATAVTPATPDRPPIVVRPGGLGDLVVATAAMEALGARPQSVDWLIERRSRVWAQHLGLRHHCYDEPSGLVRALGSGPRAVVINLEQRYGLASVAARALTSRRGVLTSFSTNRLAADADRRVEYDPRSTHELSCFARCLAAGLEIPLVDVPLRDRQCPPADYAVLALAGSGSPSRNFAAKEWARFAERLVPEGPIRIVAAPQDYGLAQRIRDFLGARASCERQSWGALVSIIQASSNVLTVDGGMVHVASYFGVPVIALFTAGRDEKWAPWSAGSRVIRRRDLGCQPCTLFGRVSRCPIDHVCRHIDTLS